MKYLGSFEVVIIFKVCSIYSICDSVNLALEIIPNIDIPFYTPKNLGFLTELHLYYFFSLLKYFHF